MIDGICLRGDSLFSLAFVSASTFLTSTEVEVVESLLDHSRLVISQIASLSLSSLEEFPRFSHISHRKSLAFNGIIIF